MLEVSTKSQIIAIEWSRLKMTSTMITIRKQKIFSKSKTNFSLSRRRAHNSLETVQSGFSTNIVPLFPAMHTLTISRISRSSTQGSGTSVQSPCLSMRQSRRFGERFNRQKRKQNRTQLLEHVSISVERRH